MAVDLIPGEFSAFTIAIAVLSGFIVFFGFVSMFIKERLFLSEAFVAVVVGIIAGPLVSNAINPYSWKDNDEFTKQLARCIIAVQVMAVGIELPKHYLKKEWKTLLVLLLPVMMFMWLISGLIIWAIIPPVNYLESLIIAACICPTDPILANSVVKGRFAEKHVPANIRNALSAESGANDGMGFPFMFLAIFLIGEQSVGVAVGKWIYVTCLFQIALSCVIGVVVGFLARKILQWSEKHHLIDKPSFLSFAIALALFLMSMTGFSGSDDVLACFVAGNAFSWDAWFKKETEEAHFQDVIDMMLNLAIFVYIGAIIPWNDFNNVALGLTPWRLVLLAVLILIFRRLPIVMLLKPLMPAVKTYREAAFSGWFGPMGVGAVFLSKIAKEELEKIYINEPMKPIAIDLINPIVLFIVLSSVLVHGTTIPLFKLGKRIRSRTLSITSLNSSASQVLHLPIFNHHNSHSHSHHHNHHNHRKSEDDTLHHHHSHHHHHHKEKDNLYYLNDNSNSKIMTELQRNTLYNTIQGERPSNNKIPLKMISSNHPSNNNNNNNTIQTYHHEQVVIEEEDLSEYLPDNSHFTTTTTIANNSLLQNDSFTYFNDDDFENTTTTVNTTDDDIDDMMMMMDQQDKEKINNNNNNNNNIHPLLPQPHFKNMSDISRRESSSTLETQCIRFVEPVKPRFSSSQTNLGFVDNHHHNEFNMSNIKQWIYKHTSLDHSSKRESSSSSSSSSLTTAVSVSGTMEEGLSQSSIINNNNNNRKSESTKHHSGLRHFFKINHDDNIVVMDEKRKNESSV